MCSLLQVAQPLLKWRCNIPPLAIGFLAHGSRLWTVWHESQQYGNYDEIAALAIQQATLTIFIGDHRQTPGGLSKGRAAAANRRKLLQRPLGLRAFDRPGDYLPPARMAALVAQLWPDASQDPESDLFSLLRLGSKPHSGPWTATSQDYELPVSLGRVRTFVAIFDVLMVFVFQMACAVNSTKLLSNSSRAPHCPIELFFGCAVFGFCLVCVSCFCGLSAAIGQLNGLRKGPHSLSFAAFSSDGLACFSQFISG